MARDPETVLKVAERVTTGMEEMEQGGQLH